MAILVTGEHRSEQARNNAAGRSNRRWLHARPKWEPWRAPDGSKPPSARGRGQGWQPCLVRDDSHFTVRSTTERADDDVAELRRDPRVWPRSARDACSLAEAITRSVATARPVRASSWSTSAGACGRGSRSAVEPCSWPWESTMSSFRHCSSRCVSCTDSPTRSRVSARGSTRTSGLG